MAKVYILSDHDECGAENVVATLDPDKVEGLFLAFPGHKIEEEYVARALLAVKTGELHVDYGLSLGFGWGCIQLHIVELA